jgi:hypothetical protein
MIKHQSKKTLALIHTPLHALQITNLINENIISNVTVICVNSSTKSIEYTQRIPNSIKLYAKDTTGNLPGIFNLFKFILMIRKFKKNNTQIIISNPKKIHSLILATYAINQKNKISIIDDGAGSIFTEGYFNNNKQKMLKYLGMKLLKIKSYSEVLQNIGTYYTIYEGSRIFDKYATNIYTHKLWKTIDIQDSNQTTTKILLTGPFSERKIISYQTELNLYNKLIQMEKIDIRIAHPSETTNKNQQIAIKTITSPLIAEEIILQTLNQHSIILYGFGSSVLLNLSSIKNIKCINIITQHLPFTKTINKASSAIDSVEID